MRENLKCLFFRGEKKLAKPSFPAYLQSLPFTKFCRFSERIENGSYFIFRGNRGLYMHDAGRKFEVCRLCALRIITELLVFSLFPCVLKACSWFALLGELCEAPYLYFVEVGSFRGDWL